MIADEAHEVVRIKPRRGFFHRCALEHRPWRVRRNGIVIEERNSVSNSIEVEEWISKASLPRKTENDIKRQQNQISIKQCDDSHTFQNRWRHLSELLKEGGCEADAGAAERKNL